MRGLARVQRAAVEVALSGGGRAAAVRRHRLVEARARAPRALHCKYYLVTHLLLRKWTHINEQEDKICLFEVRFCAYAKCLPIFLIQ